MENGGIDIVGLLVRRRFKERQRQLRLLHHRRQMVTLRGDADPFRIPDETFMERYILPKHVVRELVEELRPHVNRVERITGVPLEIKLLCALHFFAHGSHQKSLGGHFDLNLSQPTVSKAITVISKAMNNSDILKHWVLFPESVAECGDMVETHFNDFKIPGVLGFLGGTHVTIVIPDKYEDLYTNQKNVHSLNVQLVCDSTLKIFNVLARYPGSTHNSFIWKNSALRSKMMEVYRSGNECWLLGESGYPHEPWLQLPIADAAPESREGLYTRRHLKASSTVKRCIGLLRQRFHCLSKEKILHYNPIKAGLIVNCCVILHNICQGLKLPISENDVDQHDGYENEEDSDSAKCHCEDADLLNEAQQVRQKIISLL